MKRMLIVYFGLLACAGLFTSWGGSKTSATSPSLRVMTGAEPSAKIILRGLMVFQTDENDRVLTVGALNAPHHDLRIEITEKSRIGEVKSILPISELKTKGGTWSLDYVHERARKVTFYQNGVFDRTRDAGERSDTRWLVDLQGAEFYGHRLSLRPNQFAKVIRIPAAAFYTNKLTAPLMRKSGDGKFEYFGRAADELATDIPLSQEGVVLRAADGAEIFRLQPKPDTTYQVVIENVFVGSGMVSGLDHFPYYYGLFAEPLSVKYEFSLAGTEIVGTQSPMIRTVSFAPGTDRAPCMPVMLGGH